MQNAMSSALDVDLDPDFIQIHWIVRVWGTDVNRDDQATA